MDTHYYIIIDLNILAKMENCVPYIYTHSQGWVPDQHDLLMDRIMGYGVLIDSPLLLTIEEITEEQAIDFMKGV